MKHKLSVKPNTMCLDIIWGSRLFINAQIIVQLTGKLSKYIVGKEALENIFAYVNAINNQREIKLYKELQQEIDEICFLEKELHEGTIKTENKNIIDFVFESIIIKFTHKSVSKN